MKRYAVKTFAVLAAVMFLSITVLEYSAQARVGGSRSMGSRGSRSYSRPASPYQSPASPYSQPSRQYNPSPGPYQQPQSGGFLRSMAGGLVGGMLGGMLFRSLGFAGAGGMGGGIGIFEILLLAGIGYLIFRFIKKKNSAGTHNSYNQGGYQGGYQGGTVTPINQSYMDNAPESPATEEGLSHIRRMDPSFDESHFKDAVMDMFFRIQGSWMNRDLTPVASLLTEEMRRIFQQDLERLLRDKQINRLENIAVRNVDIAEAWQETGQDYITALIYANLLDYTTDDSSGAVISGSKTEPVKFEEYWTFTRPVGSNPWRLSAINQK